MRFAGIDVGKTGAVCVLDEYGDILSTIPKMPWENDRLDARRLYQFLGVWAEGGLTVSVEKVNGFGMGLKSCFTFGSCNGGIMACIDIMKARIIHVTPQRWKKAMLVDYNPKKLGKEASVKAAFDLFPQLRNGQLSKKSSHNLAEAALMAEFGRRIYLNNQLEKC